ncbi:MAG: efflux RND transporter permease subunit [Hyphomicrobiaceae bacterium]
MGSRATIGFGLERLGRVAIDAPRTTMLVLVVITSICAIGITRLGSVDTLSELFRSSSPEFQNYAEMSRNFPASEFDVLAIIEGKKLLTPEMLEKLRLLHFDLELTDAAAGVISIFSVRDKPDATGFPPPLVPDELKPGPEHEALVRKILTNPLIEGKLVASDPDGQLVLFVVSLNKGNFSQRGLEQSVDEVRSTVSEILDGEPLSIQFAGAPVMHLEIRQAIERDRIIYNFSGFAMGILLCLALFRRFGLVMIAAMCPALAVIWTMGLLGLTGFKLNTFINVLPALVMVIAFSDAMHMIFSVRRSLRGGDSKANAILHAVRTVGPACALTSISTSIAMLTLTLTDSALIRTFGAAGSIATLLAFVGVILIVPAMCMLTIRDEEKFRAEEERRAQGIVWLTNLCTRLASWLAGHTRTIMAFGLILFAAMTAAHLQLEASYRLSDQVPDNKESVSASARLDKRLTGAHPIHIMLQWPEGKTVRSTEILSTIADVHAVMQKHPRIGNVWSVDTLSQWLAGIGVTDPKEIGTYVDRLPDNLVGRFLNEKTNRTLVTGRVPNLDAADAVPVMRSIEDSLIALRTKYPDVTMKVTGLTAVSAYQSANMISQLNRGLMIAVVVVIGVMAIAFRSFWVLLVSILPNLFPLVAAGSILYLFDAGLEYASVIALTVAFGLSVDDCIHFLARYRIEKDATGITSAAIKGTLAHIGPVLILTTAVLIVGLAVTGLSDLPSMRLFGNLVMVTLIGALLADLIILPAIIATLAKRSAAPKEAST